MNTDGELIFTDLKAKLSELQISANQNLIRTISGKKSERINHEQTVQVLVPGANHLAPGENGAVVSPVAVESRTPVGQTRGVERGSGEPDVGQRADSRETNGAFALDIADALAYN